ncbi:MAG: hypothetical protein ABI859_03325 [Pseudomonadota bacterium]
MRSRLLIPLLALVFLRAMQPAPAGAAENFCDRSETKATPSPDGKWVANVQEEVCATATGAAAGITVVIASAKDPAHAKRVFIMPVPRSREDWPRIRWDGPDSMEVRVANLSEAKPPEPAYEGIRISLTYCNDNPEDRARVAAWKAGVLQWQKEVSAWATKRKLDANAAGPRPPRPEEPAIPAGRCTD